jgi:hypothetical protein
MPVDVDADADGTAPTGHPAGDQPVHVSRLLREILAAGMPPEVTLSRLTAHLRERSFGALMLVLGLIGLLPLVSVPVGLVLVPLAAQLMARRQALSLPFALDERPIASRRIAAVLRLAIPVVDALETIVHPRAQFVFRAGRLVGTVVFFLALSLLIPIPFSNIVPAFCVTLIALAYLERDGLFLALSLIAALVALAVASVALYGLALAAFY